MRLSVCVCVCTHVCASVCVCVCMYVCTCVLCALTKLDCHLIAGGGPEGDFFQCCHVEERRGRLRVATVDTATEGDGTFVECVTLQASRAVLAGCMYMCT